MATPSMSKANALIFFRSILRLISASSQRAEIGQIKGISACLGALASQIDDAELGLVLGDVVKEGVHQALGMLRGHDDAVANLRLGNAGEGGGKVYDEFTSGMGDDGQVRVRALGYLRFEFQTDLILGFGLVVIHKT